MHRPLRVSSRLLALGLVSIVPAAAFAAPPDRTLALRGCYGTYAAPPRCKDGRVDTPRLVQQLGELRVDTYNWLIHAKPTDWDDLKQFLPQARAEGIRVWVTLVPPSESPPHNRAFAEPFRLDYERWAVEIARLSLTESNLVAWSLDDFAHNLRFFTPEKLRGIVGGARRINPRLAFAPCCYFREIKARFIADYRDSLDGILFPYRAESGKLNLTDASLLGAELQQIRALAGPALPVIVDVYATAHSSLGASTADYVRQVMIDARKTADGVLVYCHQNPVTQAEKYALIQDLFQRWATSQRPRSGAALQSTPQARYRELLGIFPEDQQGFAQDLDKNADGPEIVTDHQPMTYGFVLSAEARHFRFDRNAESGRRVRKAMRWLIDNRDLDGDGKPGWGLPQAWPAWGHAPNPHHQPYTITTAIVLNGMLDASDIPAFWTAAERDEILGLAVQVALRWCRELWSDGYGGGYFWYSPAREDDIFGVNAPAMFLGSLARLLREQGPRFGPADRKLAQQRADSLAQAIVNTVQLNTGQPFWLYAPLPNKLQHERFNDLMHHVYTLWGIEAYRDCGGRIALPWSRTQALRSLDRFWKDGSLYEMAPDLPHKKKPSTYPARLCAAGMLLAGYAQWGDPQRAAETLTWIERECGPWPHLRHSPRAAADTVYLRDCSHVLAGLAVWAFPLQNSPGRNVDQ